MVELIKFLYNEGYELVIVSGSNRMFMTDYLKQKGLDKYFTALICNHLEYDEENGFTYKPFCVKTVRCQSKYCQPPCKKQLILNYLSGREVDCIYAIGDGSNDFCPMTLTKDTKAFVRKYFSLEKDLKSNKEMSKEIPGQIVYWSTGYDILEWFKK